VIEILYESAAVVALNKPAGIPSHPLEAQEIGTAANFLVDRYPETVTLGASFLEAGLVHRLDNETSGVILAARTPAARDSLRSQFAAGTVRKTYLALVVGHLDRDVSIHVPVAHDPRRRSRMKAVSDKDPATRGAPRVAVSHVRIIERLPGATLVAVRIATGVRHQVRVHLAFVGHAILGDTRYARSRQPVREAPRVMLHSLAYAVRDPSTGQRVTISAPIPADFRELLLRLRLASRT
jgi:23S rRNA pseudouridine1911/1915/1917 synthase